jgi:pimeloyl-ACP methyl ester carboxylesterase
VLDTARSVATLARWFGPWASDTSRPRVRRKPIAIDGGLSAYLYLPNGKPRGAYLIGPGVHYHGPTDPRMDRVCRILAASGAVVVSPFLPSYMRLFVDRRAIADFGRVFDAAVARPEIPAGIRPRVFSISFGSLVAIHLAAERGEMVGGLVLFGGYGNWDRTMEYCLTGQIDGVQHAAADRLNQAVIFLNMVHKMDDHPADLEPLYRAWHKFCRLTWGREDTKRDEGFFPAAHSVARELSPELRHWFLVGCGVEPGNRELCRAAIAKAGAEGDYLHADNYLDRVLCPITFVHGIDDDVIPYVESERMYEQVRHRLPSRLFLTGLYGHSSGGGSAGGPGALLREIMGLGGILAAVAP